MALINAAVLALVCCLCAVDVATAATKVATAKKTASVSLGAFYSVCGSVTVSFWLRGILSGHFVS